MRKLYLSIFFFLSLAIYKTHAQAPTIQWQKTFGGTNFDQVESVIQTFDGGFIAAGIATSTNGNVTGNHGFGDFWLIKMNGLGVLQWQKSLGGSADEGAFCIRQTVDSGYVVAGSSTSNDGNVSGNHGLNDYWVVKVNSAGTLQWQKSLGGSSVDIAYDIRQTSDGGYIVAGYTISNDGDVTGNHGFEDYWIVKLNSTGTLQWQKTFGGSMDERAYSIQQTTDGGYVAGGYTKSSDGDVTGNHGDYDYWLIKLSSTGTLQWQKALGGTSSDQAHTVQQTADGGYIIAGFTASVNGDVTFNHGFEDLWIVKLNSTGALQWQKSLGGSGVDQAYQIKQLSNGGYIVGGSSYSLNGDVTGNHGGYDDWIVRTDNVGNIVWQKSLGGSSVEEAYSISPTTNNGYIVAGGTLSNDGNVTGNHGDFDYWVVKLNDTSNPLPVELLSFEGINSGDKNEIKWSTASETNNAYYELQRKYSLENFKTISRLAGSGNSNTLNSYNYEDADIKPGTLYYYQLKQIDFNGEAHFSKVIDVKTMDSNLPVQIIQLFGEADAYFIYSLNESAQVHIELFNLQGQKIKTIYTGYQEAGKYSQKFGSYLTEGMYLIQFLVNDKAATLKYTKTYN